MLSGFGKVPRIGTVINVIMFGTVLMAAYFGHSDYVGLVSLIWISFMIGDAVGVHETYSEFFDVFDDLTNSFKRTQKAYIAEMNYWRGMLMASIKNPNIEPNYAQLLIKRDLVGLSKLLKIKHQLQCTGVKPGVFDDDFCDYDAIYFDDIKESILIVNDIWYHMCGFGYVRQMTEAGLCCYLQFLDEFATAEVTDITK